MSYLVLRISSPSPATEGPNPNYHISPCLGCEENNQRLGSAHVTHCDALRCWLLDVYVVGQLSSRTRHRVLAMAALDKSLSMV